MKLVLIITSRSEKTVAWSAREQYIKDFCQTVSSELDNVKVCYTTYRDLNYHVIKGGSAIFDTQNEIDLKDVHLVHFKNWQYEKEEAPVVAGYLKHHGVPFFNTEVNLPIANGKLAQMFILARNNLPVPDTFYAPKEQLRSLFEQEKLPGSFHYPLIMKANDASRGDDNHLIGSAKEALDILSASDPEKEYVLQNYIKNDGDYRFLFVGLDRTPLVFHRKGEAGSHLNNTSKGGSGTFIKSNQLPAEYTHYAHRASELLGREIAGTDIIVDSESGKPYILEVNGTPALATGYGVGTKTQRFARFVKEVLDPQEEE